MIQRDVVKRDLREGWGRWSEWKSWDLRTGRDRGLKWKENLDHWDIGCIDSWCYERSRGGSRDDTDDSDVTDLEVRNLRRNEVLEYSTVKEIVSLTVEQIGGSFWPLKIRGYHWSWMIIVGPDSIPFNKILRSCPGKSYKRILTTDFLVLNPNPNLYLEC